jgi:ABC-2 type transport system permease protein
MCAAARILGWLTGLGMFTIIYMAFFPAMPAEFLELDLEGVDIYRSLGMMNIVTFEGYLFSSVFNFLPLLAGVFGTVMGVGALAGEEDSGTLELLAALPLSRAQLVLAKAAALAAAALLVSLALGLLVVGIFALIGPGIETRLTGLDLFTLAASHWLVMVVFMSVGLFMGAYLPNRAAATAAATTLLVFSFFGNNLAGMVTDLEPARPALPFYHFDQIKQLLLSEADWSAAAVLLLMAGLFTVLAVLSFQRRNLTVGAWPWQRGRVMRRP